MAKKLIVSEVKRASNALKDFQIEHVIVTRYKNFHGDKLAIRFIVIPNRNLEAAKACIKEAGISILKVKGVRHYKDLAICYDYYEPKFWCKCRHCGKQFSSHVKEAVWCSPKCKQEFRKAKK